MTYVAEDEEKNVDERVGRADAALHPDWRRRVSIVMGVLVVADRGVVTWGPREHTWEWREEDG